MLRRALILVIRGYRTILSPLLPRRCRYYPSCSLYAIGCLEKYGLAKAVWLSVKRVLRCHPWFPGGYDPVP